MVGLPKLNNTLNLAAHEPLRQRITMNYQETVMKAINESEIG